MWINPTVQGKAKNEGGIRGGSASFNGIRDLKVLRSTAFFASVDQLLKFAVEKFGQEPRIRRFVDRNLEKKMEKKNLPSIGLQGVPAK
jgi:hypothetical protein